MEIKMIECPNGHYYNAAAHAACPECAKGAVNPDLGSFPKTAPPTMGGAPMPGMGGAVGQTMPVNNAVPAGGATPFGVPTMAAGNLAADSQIEPVVGWLVCIDGPLRGVDFRIHDGYNYIGREEGDIHLHGDTQISRQKHAVISFYSKRQTFHVGPAEGRNIIELNGEPVFSPVEMKNHDILTVGSTKLMLVALCGTGFNWMDGVINE